MPLILISFLGFIKDNWKYFFLSGLFIASIGFVFHIKHELSSVHKLKSEISQQSQHVQFYSRTLDQQKTINDQINQSYNSLLSQDQTTQQTVAAARPAIKQIVGSPAPVSQKQAEVSTRINADLDMLGGAQ